MHPLTPTQSQCARALTPPPLAKLIVLEVGERGGLTFEKSVSNKTNKKHE